VHWRGGGEGVSVVGTHLRARRRSTIAAVWTRWSRVSPRPTVCRPWRRPLLAALAARREAEIERGVLLVGPHRDDLELWLGDHPAKGFASHGESWSMALSLRLASYELLRRGRDAARARRRATSSSAKHVIEQKKPGRCPRRGAAHRIASRSDQRHRPRFTVAGKSLSPGDHRATAPRSSRCWSDQAYTAFDFGFARRGQRQPTTAASRVCTLSVA